MDLFYGGLEFLYGKTVLFSLFPTFRSECLSTGQITPTMRMTVIA